MAIVFVEGFDIYNGTGGSAAGSVGAGVRWTLSGTLTTGRFGGQALQQSYGTGIKTDYASVPSSYSQGTLGFAFYSSATTAGDTIIATLGTGTTSGQLSLVYTTTNAIAVYRGGPGGALTQLGISANNVITPTSWAYIELEFVIDNSVGLVRLYVNGVNQVTVTNVDTQALSGNTYNVLVFGVFDSTGYGFTAQFDDVYVTDTPSRLGEQKIVTIRPDANASPVDWTRSNTSVAAYTLVNETLCDGDTTYLSSSTVGQQALFDMVSPGVTADTVYGVQLSTFTRKTDTGLRKIQLQYQDTTTSTYSSSELTLGGGYTRLVDILATNPISSSAWTNSDLNNMKVGVKVST